MSSQAEFKCIKEQNVTLKRDMESSQIKSLAVTSSGAVLLVDFSNMELKLFSKNLDDLSILRLEDKPWDVCLNGADDTYAYVTIPFEEKIQKVKLTGEMSVECAIDTKGVCRGVTWFMNGLAVSVMVDGKYQIHLLDATGVLKSRIKTSFVSPFLLCTNHTDTGILVSDYESNTVACINNCGDILFEYRDKELSRPSDMTADRTHIYIAGYGSGNVHKVKTRGEKVKVVLSWEDIGLVPQAIGFNIEDNSLVIAGEGDIMKVFSFQDTEEGQ